MFKARKYLARKVKVAVIAVCVIAILTLALREVIAWTPVTFTLSINNSDWSGESGTTTAPGGVSRFYVRCSDPTYVASDGQTLVGLNRLEGGNMAIQLKWFGLPYYTGTSKYSANTGVTLTFRYVESLGTTDGAWALAKRANVFDGTSTWSTSTTGYMLDLNPSLMGAMRFEWVTGITAVGGVVFEGKMN